MRHLKQLAKKMILLVTAALLVSVPCHASAEDGTEYTSMDYVPVQSYYYYDNAGYPGKSASGSDIFIYDYHAPQVNDVIRLTDSSGTVTDITCVYDEESGKYKWIDQATGTDHTNQIGIFDDQKADPWVIPEDHEFIAEAYDQRVEVQVRYGKVSAAYEQSRTKWFYYGIDEYYNQSGDGPFYRPEELLQEGDKLTLYYSNGDTRSYTVKIDEDRFPRFEEDRTGLILDASLWSLESDREDTGNIWQVGNDYTGKLTVFGQDYDIDVRIADSPISEFRFEPAAPIEFTAEDVGKTVKDGSKSFTFFDVYSRGPNGFFANGDKVTLVYKDSSIGTVTYTYDEEKGDFYHGSERIPFAVCCDDSCQYDDHWHAGNNPQIIQCGGMNAEAVVKISYQNGGLVVRVSGADRYDTSIETADALKQELIRKGVIEDKFETIILASGDNFPDALSGSYLAAKKHAPILITSKGAYKKINAYINENLSRTGTLYVLGGQVSVPDSLLSGLDPALNTPQRLDGTDRYDTNLKILEEAGIDDEAILISSGAGFADSLSASAVKCPILLVGKSMTADQQAFFERAEFDDNAVYILGGSAAVGPSVEKVIKGKNRTFKRLSGPSRYDTSRAIAEEFFKEKKPEDITIAYAWLYPDGLCGGPLAAEKGCPLLLTKDGSADAAISYAKEQGIHTGITFGGAKWMPDSAVMSIYGLSDRLQIVDFEDQIE